MNNLVPVGIILILLGFAIVIIGSLSQAKEAKVAVGGMIGFIPFGFANDKRLLYFAYGLIAFMFITWIILNFKRIT